MLLYLIRHAQSENNARPEEERVEDPGLTEIGHEQARRLGEWIPCLELTRLITSPFRRALLTAQAIHKTTPLTPQVRVHLHEQGGCYQGHEPGNLVGRPGMGVPEITREFAGFETGSDLSEGGWWASKPYESEEQASRRAREIILRAQDEFAGTNERVAFVMHADIKLLVLGHLDTKSLDVPCNTSITTIEIDRRRSRLVDFNRVDHLSDELVTQ